MGSQHLCVVCNLEDGMSHLRGRAASGAGSNNSSFWAKLAAYEDVKTNKSYHQDALPPALSN